VQQLSHSISTFDVLQQKQKMTMFHILVAALLVGAVTAQKIPNPHGEGLLQLFLPNTAHRAT